MSRLSLSWSSGAILNPIPKFAKKTNTYIYTYIYINPSRFIESLSRSTNPWYTLVRFHLHKNLQPAYCQEGVKPCWKVKNTQNSEISFNFSLLVSFEHNASLQATSWHPLSLCFYSIFLLVFVLQICGFNNCSFPFQHLGIYTKTQY